MRNIISTLGRLPTCRVETVFDILGLPVKRSDFDLDSMVRMKLVSNYMML